MSTLAKTALKPLVRSEYDVLRQVIVCEPEFMEIRDVINETQKKYKHVGIHTELAKIQHQNFVNSMEANGVEVIRLTPQSHFPEQVFTRDIGFTYGPVIFVAEMAHELRQGEEQVLKDWLEENDISYFNLKGDKIEGGDVIVDGHTIYVGLSNRTNHRAIEQLKAIFPQHEVVMLPFEEKYLHLDCVFNIISPTEAIYFPEAFTQKEIDILTARFELIEVTTEEQFTMGTNMLSIGNKKIFSLPINKKINSKLKRRGYDVIEVDIMEIIKSGGSFRCCTLPVVRE
ncbi:dimethylarginine dimethylaminohydrolase family protein [Bacillus sp. FJAT-45066]|uniref:dimethylarginine dimethylaminohydrolase family protein n=1 Tax=Bacillus sp. FJAT-45066 TaxID=2011010 RepID=UPI000BB96204|nr:dimethylarginine dimethylaminohydrolase family protein [Bacillus sp. FJAT-45066]